MHAFLISSPPTRFPPGPDCLHLVPDPSLGIAEVRQLESFLAKKPLRLPRNIAVLHQAEKLTLPAQHALLKTLEEPPGDAHIYLVTTQPESLLPTILSRIQISDSSKPRPFDPAAIKKSQELLDQLLAAGVGERLALFDQAAFTRESALEFLDHLEYLLHQNLSLSLDYNLLVDTRKYLKSNVNLKLALDHFALHL